MKSMNSMKKYDMIIGIDPDIKTSGVAVLRCINKTLKLHSINFPTLAQELMSGANKRHNVLYVIEAGHLNKSNWHIKQAKSKEIAAEIGNRTGQNHAVAKLIYEIGEFNNIDIIETRPLAKVWGSNSKISHKEFVDKCKKDGFEFHKNQTNQEERDAGLIALAFYKKQNLKK